MRITLHASKSFWLSTAFQVNLKLLVEIVIINYHWLVQTLCTSWLWSLLFTFVMRLRLNNNLRHLIFLIIILSIHISSCTVYYAWLWNSTIGGINRLVELVQNIHWILHVLDIILIWILQVRNILSWELSMRLVVLSNWAYWMGLVHLLSIHHIINHRVVLGLILILIIFFYHIFIITISMLIYPTLAKTRKCILCGSQGRNAVVMACNMS